MSTLDMFAVQRAPQAVMRADEDAFWLRYDALLDTLQSEYLDTTQRFPWVLKYSGGKDSNFLAHAVFHMLLRLPQGARSRPVVVVCNDTLVENPAVSAFARKMLAMMQDWATVGGLPISCHVTTPDPSQTFWACVLGKGYPPPRSDFKWCVRVLKLQPSEAIIRTIIADAGGAVVLLGSRSDESPTRAASIEAHGGTAMEPDTKLKGALNWQPISGFTTEEVWLLLYTKQCPWGASYRELQTLYANARGSDACAMVLRAKDADACSGGRFGCHTCTVVETDDSLDHYIDNGHEHWQPLADLRKALLAFRNDPRKRDTVSRKGVPRFDKLGYPVGHGPFTVAARRELLQLVIAAQEASGVELLTAHEAAFIRAQWLLDEEQDTERQAKAEERRMVRAEEQRRAAEEFRLEPWTPGGTP